MDKKEYRIGRLTLLPFRQLLDGRRPVPIKPKALAVLSVLARAEGALVTKSDLMAAVWPSITVEDNALQAHIASLRKIMDRDAGLLSTVHGHGYRLTPSPAIPSGEAAAERDTMPVRRHGRSAYILAAAALLSVAVAVMASLWLARSGATKAPKFKTAQVAILPSDLSGSQMDGLADALLERISTQLSDARILVASRKNGDARRLADSLSANGAIDAEFFLSSRVKSDGKMVRILVQLNDTQERVTIWSASFQEHVGSQLSAVDHIAAAVATAARAAVIGRSGKIRLNASGVAAFIEARESIGVVRRSSSAVTVDGYRKVIAAAPEFTWGHSGLAVAHAFQLRFDPENTALRDTAKREAARALALDPNNGEAYVALELLLPRLEWKAREALLLKGIAADPNFEPAAMMEARLLWSVGRNRDALPWFKRAHAIDPLHNDNNFTYAASLSAHGQFEESRMVLEQMDALWPDSIKTKDAHFWTSVISSTTGKTMTILSDATKWPMGMNQKSAEIWRTALAARDTKNGAFRLHAIQAVKNAATDGRLGRGEALLLLSMLGDTEAAFAQAQYYEPLDPKWGPFLFLEPTRALRVDRRFMLLAVKFGFAAYWRSTGQWPDFCGAPDLPYDCKAEVDKIAAKDPDLKPMTNLSRIASTY